MINEQKYFPTVSVIIPIYNGEADLSQLIECLFQQTYPTELSQFLLIDNNSSDRTAILLKEAEQKAILQKINLKHLTEKEIQSSYAARNLGIRQAEGEILVFTDADCRPHLDWLEQIVQPFNNTEVGIVVGEVIPLFGKSLLEKYADRNEIMSQKFLLQHPFFPYGQTANLAIRKQAFLKVGLFRPYLTTGGDADICWRIQKETAWQLVHVPTAIIEHRHRSSLKNFRSQFRRYGSSNRYLHELHGVALMRQLTHQEVFYRLSRWLLKEIPRDSFNAIAGKIAWIDLLKTPIDLIGFQARTQGQQESKLSEAAKQVEWL